MMMMSDISERTKNTAVHKTSLSSMSAGPMVDHSICLSAIGHESPALLSLPTMAEDWISILTGVQQESVIESYDDTLENMSQSDDQTFENNVLDDGSPNVPERTETASMLDYQMQPKLSAYNPKRFGNETSTRDFKPEWFKDYPWLKYCVKSQTASCFACKTFMNKNDFVFINWNMVELLRQNGWQHAKTKGTIP